MCIFSIIIIIINVRLAVLFFIVLVAGDTFVHLLTDTK